MSSGIGVTRYPTRMVIERSMHPQFLSNTYLVGQEGGQGFFVDTLLALPPETVMRPGHTEPTTVADEWESNPFVRVWRGVDPEGDEACTAMGQPATLILLGDDYDGGHKAWVRWADGGDDIVPGSQVKSA